MKDETTQQKKVQVQIAKGVKDWYGKNAILRNNVRAILRKNFEKYGYNPIETPCIELQSTIGYKGGGEIQKEVFRLQDQGARELALRFDHTVPLARFFATHQEIKLPFKRYAIGEVFRDGPTQPEQGRYRIFTQCDIDVLGVSSVNAEVELFALARDCLSELGLGNVDVKVNNRKILDGIMDVVKVPTEYRTSVLVALDKMDKIGIEGVRNELLNIYDNRTNTTTKPVLDIKNVDELLNFVSLTDSNDKTYQKLSAVLGDNEGLDDMRTILDQSMSLGYDFVQFDPALARGLDYYTGTTLEVYLQDKSVIKSAILAGGRYDKMVGEFCGDDRIVPAVGMSFGLERIVTVLEAQGIQTPQTNTQIYLVPIGEQKSLLRTTQQIREQGINADLCFTSTKKIGQQVSYADSIGIPYVGFIGDEEQKNNTVCIKNLKTGIQEQVPLNEVGKYLNNK